MARPFTDRWSLTDTFKLLDILETFVAAEKLRGTCRDCEEYKKIAMKLNRSGVLKDTVQIKNKVKYLKRAYKHAKENPGSRHSFPFYEKMDRIYGAKDITLPLIISNVGTVPEEEDEEEQSTILPSLPIESDTPSPADTTMSDVPSLHNIKVEVNDDTYEAESPQPQPMATTSAHNSKKPLERENEEPERKRAKVNHFKEAFQDVMRETTEKILNFMREVEENSAQRTAEFRYRTLAQNRQLINQNQEIIDLLRRTLEK